MFKTLKRFFIIGLMIMIGVSTFEVIPSHASDQATEPVTLQLRWHHQFQFAGYYAALWQGYYKDEGLSVEILPGFDEKGRVRNAVEEVERGRAQFGVGAVDALLARDRGADVKLVASFFQRSAVEFYVLPSTQVKSLADLPKLKLFRRQGDLLDIELQAMLASEGIELKDKRLLPANTEVGAEDLIERRYDLVPGYLGTIPYYSAKSGSVLRTLKPIDYGIDFYGDSLFTSGKLVNENPELVEKFRRASIRGWQYALEHPGEIALKIARTYQDGGRDEKERLAYNLNQSVRVAELTYYPVVEVGNVNPYRWQKTEEILAKLGFIEEVRETEDFIFDYQKIQAEAAKARQKQVTNGLIAALLLSLMIYLVQLNVKNNLLAKSSRRYQSIFNNAAMGITVTDSKGRLIQINDTWTAMTGYSLEDMLGQSIYDYIAPEDREKAILENTAGLMRDGFIAERRYIKKNGSVFWGRLYLTVLHDESSETHMNLGMVIDITGQKHESAALRRNEALLIHHAKQAAMGEMVANIAHQWRQPLNNLSLVMTNLEEAYFYGEMDADYLGKAVAKARRLIGKMSDTIDDFRNFMAPGQKKALFDVREVLQGVLDLMAENTAYHGIRTSLKIENDQPLKIFGHANHLSQAVFNIVSNAVDALGGNKSSDRWIQIRVSSHFKHEDQSAGDDQGEPWFLIEITDNGGGIALGDSVGHIHQVFDAYFTTKPSNKGTGLGLYITKVIVESSMKGSIALENTNDGLKVSLWIPAALNEEAQNGDS